MSIGTKPSKVAPIGVKSSEPGTGFGARGLTIAGAGVLAKLLVPGTSKRRGRGSMRPLVRWPGGVESAAGQSVAAD